MGGGGGGGGGSNYNSYIGGSDLGGYTGSGGGSSGGDGVCLKSQFRSYGVALGAKSTN